MITKYFSFHIFGAFDMNGCTYVKIQFQTYQSTLPNEKSYASHL